MYNAKTEMTLRNCYDKDGQIISNDTHIEEYKPLQELLEMFRSVHEANASVPLEKVG